MPTQSGHQDLGALLARQPEVSQRWRAHVMASPFGSVQQVAGFNFPRPVGTAIPALQYRTASLTPGADDMPAHGLGAQNLGAQNLGAMALPHVHPLELPQVNRRLKGDRIALPPQQPEPGAGAIQPNRVRSSLFPRPAGEIGLPAEALGDIEAQEMVPQDDEGTGLDLQAALAAETLEEENATADGEEPVREADIDPIDDPDPAVRIARIYFGNVPIGDAVGPIEPWPDGEEPVLVMPPPADREVKPAAPQEDDGPPVATAPAEPEKAGETVARKGEVTGAEQRPKTPAERLGLDGAQRTRAERCLAEAVYFEARSEPVRGQVAVAQVVMNRVFSSFYPSTVCGVVFQNAHRRNACQFTFACDGTRRVFTERELWDQAQQISRDTLDGKIWVPEVGKSTHYHANYVNPWWVRSMRRNARIGAHIFYRPRRWGDGADEPRWGPGVTVPAAPTAQAGSSTASL